MSRLADLIARLCPDGVHYSRLDEVAVLRRGKSITKSDVSQGAVPVVAGGRSAAYFHSESNRDGETIVVAGSGAYAGFVSWWDEPIFVSDAFSIEPIESLLDGRYCYHWLRSQQKRIHGLKSGGGVPHVYPRDLAGLRLPVPPREAQREVARILDEFELLERALEDEVDARRRQYDYYQQQLLTPRDGWTTTKLGAVAQIFDGPHATPKKTASGPWYLSISSLQNGRFDLEQSAHLDDDEYPRWTRRVQPQRGDTMFSYETRIGQAAFWDSDEPAALGRRMGLLRPRETAVELRFLTLAYLGPQFQSVIRANTVAGSTVDRIPIADMASWELSLPDLPEQRRIVQILGEFEALIDGSDVGIAAELRARRKQFAHYRDQIFAFEEAAA